MVFSFALLVVIGYWVLVLLGGVEADTDADIDFLDGLGLGGVPVTVVLSVMVAVAWFVSLAGTVLVDGAILSIVVLVAALGCAWAAARLLVPLLRRPLPTGPEPSRADFVGRTCVVRTGRVGPDFGQAEDDPVSRAAGAVGLLADRVGGVKSAIDRLADRP